MPQFTLYSKQSKYILETSLSSFMLSSRQMFIDIGIKQTEKAQRKHEEGNQVKRNHEKRLEERVRHEPVSLVS